MSSAPKSEAALTPQESAKASTLAAKLLQQREQRSEEFEKKLKQIEAASRQPVVRDDKFVSAEKIVDYEAEFKAKTVGLVTVEEFRKASEEAAAKEAAAKARALAGVKDGAASKLGTTANDLKRKRAMLTFNDDEEDTGERPVTVPPVAPTTIAVPGGTADQAGVASNSSDGLPEARRPKLLKDPTVDTHFLPDAERERQEAALRIELKKEWELEQERVKKDKIEVTYSWWDGSGHRRVIVVPKGTPIGRFLEWVRQDLVADFPSLKTTSSDNMMYVKEDCIIPHHISFYDLILNKARGKSGPLFQFDVHEDIRLKADARIEKDESHPGKVVERRWYEKNKHLFPASRWEEFDLAKQRAEGYTIRGGEVNSRRP